MVRTGNTAAAIKEALGTPTSALGDSVTQGRFAVWLRTNTRISVRGFRSIRVRLYQDAIVVCAPRDAVGAAIILENSRIDIDRSLP